MYSLLAMPVYSLYHMARLIRLVVINVVKAASELQIHVNGVLLLDFHGLLDSLSDAKELN